MSTDTTEVVISATYVRDADGFPADQPKGPSRKDVAALVAAGWVVDGERYELRRGVPTIIVSLTRVA